MPATRVNSRRIQCYCVGTGKTGTHSIAGIFAKSFRAAHEPEAELLISKILELGEERQVPGGAIRFDSPSQDNARAFLRERDRRLFLELESDGTLYHFLELLIKEFPEATFILTIRDCYTWLDSVFNHNISKRPGGFWRQFDDFQFASWDFRHVKEERSLADYGLRTLRHYLNHWTTHNQAVIENTPKDRLLILRTDQIQNSAAGIAAFLGIAADALDMTRSHLFKNTHKFNLLSSINRAFLEENVHQYCRPLMQKYFPEIENYDQILSAR